MTVLWLCSSSSYSDSVFDCMERLMGWTLGPKQQPHHTNATSMSQYDHTELTDEHEDHKAPTRKTFERLSKGGGGQALYCTAAPDWLAG